MNNWLECELTFKSYLPLRLEVGMMFFRNLGQEEVELFTLDKIPENQEDFMKWNGTPVELFITDDNDNIIASHEEIGWFDEGEDSDELRDITIKDLNIILNRDSGILDVSIEVDEENGYNISIVEGKVVIRFVQESEEVYEEEDDDDEDDICSSCNGSGEGMYDGSTCGVCGGSGVNNY